MRVRKKYPVPKFKDQKAKLQWLRDDADRSAVDPVIVELASRIVRGTRPDDWAGMVSRIHEWVRDMIRYQHDPNRMEEFAPLRAILERARDDCDGKARLAVALAKSLGITARVWPVWRGPLLAHVQAGYKWPGSERYPGARDDGWVIGELTVRGAELGQDPRTIPRNPDTGRLPLA